MVRAGFSLKSVTPLFAVEVTQTSLVSSLILRAQPDTTDGKYRFVIEPNLPSDATGLRFHLDTYALSLGKPAFVPEFGGLATSDGDYVNAQLVGIRSVMAGLGMLDGIVLRPERVTWFDEGITIRVKQGGLWQPKISIGDVVQESDLLGHVLDSFGRVVEEVRSPARGEVLSFTGTPPIMAGEAVVFLGRTQ
jgi:predicted deacylase